MTVIEYLNGLEYSTMIARDKPGGEALIRINTIWEDVINYLVAKGSLDWSDDIEKFNAFRNEFTISAMYRVANNYRRKEGMPLLDYPQAAYHNKENKLEDWRNTHG